LTLFFQFLLLYYRSMILCHVTAVTCLFIVQEIKEKEKKIKLRKIDKRKSKYNIRVPVHYDTSMETYLGVDVISMSFGKST